MGLNIRQTPCMGLGSNRSLALPPGSHVLILHFSFGITFTSQEVFSLFRVRSFMPFFFFIREVEMKCLV